MPVLVQESLVANLFQRVDRAGLHIVLKPECVPHLVSEHEAQQFSHEVIGERKLLCARIECSDLNEVPVFLQVLNVVVELDICLENLAGPRIVDVRA